MTRTELRKQQAEEVKQRVMELLGWDEQRYANNQYEKGLEYLEQYLPNDEWARKQYSLTRAYWSWWRIQWHLRDELFVAHAHRMLWADRVAEYQELHNPVMLADENTHTGRYMDSSFVLVSTECRAEKAEKVQNKGQ